MNKIFSLFFLLLSRNCGCEWASGFPRFRQLPVWAGATPLPAQPDGRGFQTHAPHHRDWGAGEQRPAGLPLEVSTGGTYYLYYIQTIKHTTYRVRSILGLLWVGDCMFKYVMAHWQHIGWWTPESTQNNSVFTETKTKRTRGVLDDAFPFIHNRVYQDASLLVFCLYCLETSGEYMGLLCGTFSLCFGPVSEARDYMLHWVITASFMRILCFWCFMWNTGSANRRTTMWHHREAHIHHGWTNSFCPGEFSRFDEQFMRPDISA